MLKKKAEDINMQCSHSDVFSTSSGLSTDGSSNIMTPLKHLHSALQITTANDAAIQLSCLLTLHVVIL